MAEGKNTRVWTCDDCGYFWENHEGGTALLRAVPPFHSYGCFLRMLRLRRAYMQALILARNSRGVMPKRRRNCRLK